MTQHALEARFAQLSAHLATGRLSQADYDTATDFAIDANAGGRADLTLALLEPLSLRPGADAKLWQLLGLAYRDEQRMAEAIAAFERAAALAPQDIRIAMGRAQIALEAGQPASALFKPVRAAVPQDGEVALSAAAALIGEGRYDAAEGLLVRILVEQPRWLRGQDALATMRWMGGAGPDFARGYGAAARANPGDLALRLAWYRAVSQVGLWDEAQAIIAEGRALFADRIEFDAVEAHIATETGEDELAELLFAKAIPLGDPGTQVSHIRHCLRTGRVGQAEAIAKPMLGGATAAAVWPYMSLVWRLLGDERAYWLDGVPPFVRSFDLPISTSELSALADILRQLHKTVQHPPEQSLRGGTQTDGHLFLRLEPELRSILKLVQDAVRDYVDRLPPFDAGHPLLGTPRGKLMIAGAWSVRLAAQGFHVCHTHPVGWISSALYVALPDGDRLGKAPAGWIQHGGPPPELRLGLEPYMHTEPKAGRLVLFPSTMWHGTEPFDDGERLTIAFDVANPAR